MEWQNFIRADFVHLLDAFCTTVKAGKCILIT